MTFKSGYVAVMGRPNVGKSTLMNTLLGQKVAAVSPRPQTTRRRQLGILTLPEAQVVFIDTPGVHEPRYKLGEIMMEYVQEALEDSDVILFLADGSEPPQPEDQLLAKLLSQLKRHIPVVLVINKIDLLPAGQLPERQQAFEELVHPAATVSISAAQGENLPQLLEAILSRLPEGEPLYEEEALTDVYERDIAGDLIREAALNILRDEVPHGITVRVDEFTERSEEVAFIAATIFVERESHKGIVIGQGGSMLKKIGSAARQEIENMSGRKVFLQLRVKVRKNWRNDERVLRQLGYKKTSK